MQTKWESVKESSFQIAVGLVLSLATQLIVFPMYEIKINFGQNLQILGIFTAVSWTRQFCIRRFFNHRDKDV